jgi:hypothetical protein
MARPKSMGDFTNLLDPSYEPLAGHHPEKDRPRKKASISLAAGLIMNSEIQSPKSMIASPRRDRKTEGSRDSGATEGLFYAYAQTVCVHMSKYLLVDESANKSRHLE